MPNIMDWDAAYRGEIFGAPPPWNIGEPQPEIAQLIRLGKLRSSILDAGCGIGDTSIELAARGYSVVGIDGAATAIEAARRVATNRGLTNVTFIEGDVTKLDGYDAAFTTILDCTLFHALPLEVRDDYLRSTYRAASPDAHLYMLVLTTAAKLTASTFPMPNLVTGAELRDAVSKYWQIDDIRPSSVLVQPPPHMNLPARQLEVDGAGRIRVPALLLSARKSDSLPHSAG